MENEIKLNSIEEFKKKLEEEIRKEKERQNVESESELAVPPQNCKQHGTLAVVKLNGLALTTTGQLTRTAYFDNLEATANMQYGDIVLTAEEAMKLAAAYRKLSTGVSAVVPMRCTGEKCPFRDDCVYFQIGKAPVGKQCKLEFDLMNYNTKRLVEQFNVDVNNHTDLMLIQELSELLVYEMRLARILGGWTHENDPAVQANAMQLTSMRNKITVDGDIVEESTVHWAFEAMEKIKNRRLKILNALQGTPSARKQSKKDESVEHGDYQQDIRDIKRILRAVSAKEIPIESIED